MRSVNPIFWIENTAGMKKGFFLFVLFFIPRFAFSQSVEIERPAVWGIAKMTFLVSDFQLARNYYRDFLGFAEAFSYDSENGKVISFKVNNRQFLEFIEDNHSGEKTRLVSVSFETSNVEQMRLYLNSRGVAVPSSPVTDGAGNQTIVVHDPSGVAVEFINFNLGGLHKKSEGRYLSDKRIAVRLHHVGLFTKNVPGNNRFYKDILGCNMVWRYPEDGDEANIAFAYLQFPDCAEFLEYLVSDDPNVSHPCFLVIDMQETIYTLKGRQNGNIIGKPIIGKGKRWILNMKNSDGTKVEFTEAHTVR